MLTVKFLLKEVLEERKITQKELSKMAMVREATISEIVRGSRTVINFHHLASIAEALNITDINKLMTLEKVKE